MRHDSPNTRRGLWAGCRFNRFLSSFAFVAALAAASSFMPATATADLEFVRTTFNDAYTPITVGGGATPLMVAANDSTKSIPLPFEFSYAGAPYTTSNFLAINANGFAFPTRNSVTQSFSFLANNANLFSFAFPNGTMAPWYDDLSVGAVGGNPAGQVLYQTQGTPGSRTLTVQWTNVSSFSNVIGGQPRQLNFQLILYEATGDIEFRYGATSGVSYSTLESASIGLEDTLSGNGRYIDGVTGSRFTNHGMMTSNKWPDRFLRFTPGNPTAIAGGTYDVGVGQTYPNITEAVADINHRGIGGRVTMRLTDAVYDSSGGNWFPILVGPIDGTFLYSVTIEPASGTATLSTRGTASGNCGNQILTSVIGTTNEPVIGLVGADSLILRDLVIDGGSLVDRGLLLTQSATNDGSQNNIVEGMTISLDRTNTSSIAIQQSSSTAPSGAAGTHSGNHYYNLDISDVYAGISLAGHATEFDWGCEIGTINGGTTVIGGPNPNDIGGGTLQTFGIRATNVSNFRVFDTEVRNVTGIGTSSVDGIAVEIPGSSTRGVGIVQVFRNHVHDLTNFNNNGGLVTGIRVNLSANATSSSRVFNNFVNRLSTNSAAVGSRRLLGIQLQSAGGGAGSVHNVDFNNVHIASSGLSGSNACFEIGTVSGPVINVRNNVFGNFTPAQSGAAKHYAWVTPSATSIGPVGSVSDRNVLYLSNTVNGALGLAGGVDRVTLPDWQTVAGSDSNSFSTNPQYINGDDLHIHPTNSTPVESNGSLFGGAIGWVVGDFDGDLRNASTPDIGADEGNFVALQNDDLAASSFVDPVGGGSKQQDEVFTPEANFENPGLLDQTDVKVRYSIIGPNPATTVIYEDSATIALFPSGSSQQIAFSSTSISASGTYNMDVEVELPGDANPANNQIVGQFQVFGALSGDYLVGNAQLAPFNTLTGAIDQLETLGMSGPVRFLLEDEIYGGESFPITITPIAGAGPAAGLTIKPAPGTTPSFTGSDSRALIEIDGADYVTIDGSNTEGGTSRDLTFTNLDASFGGAVLWMQTSAGSDAATHNTIENTVVIGAGNSLTLIGIGNGGSTISTSTGGSGNDDNVIRNNDIRRVLYGITSAGTSGNVNSNTLIDGNVMALAAPDNVGEGGILVRFEDSPQITGNHIQGIATGSANTPFGISLGTVQFTTTALTGDEVTNATVARNTITDIASTHPSGYSAAGIVVVETGSGTTTIANNMIGAIVSPANDPDVTAGILLGGGSASTNVWFNSVSMTGDRGSATAPSFALAVAGSHPVLDLRNNILYNGFSSASADDYAIGLEYGSPYSNLTNDYNDVYTEGPLLAVTGGFLNTPIGDETNLSGWRSETGEGSNSISANPLFTSNVDLHIQKGTSAVSNLGTPIGGITTDIDGEAGNRATTPDIGADEFGTWQLFTTVSGQGSIGKSPDQTSYAHDVLVDLTATPDVGWHFVDWTGDAGGTNPNTQVSMNADKSVQANFEINTYAVTTPVVGLGSVDRSPDLPLYDYGTLLTLVAVPGSGQHFVGWSGDTTEANDSLVVTVTSARSYTATFEPDSLMLVVSATGSGSVSKDPDQPIYIFNSTVDLTANPDPGHSFIEWLGDASGTDNPLTVTMDDNKDITARFTSAIDISVVGNGSVAKNPDQSAYNYLEPLELTATPDVGWHFVSWSGDTSSTNNPITLTMDDNKSVTATFEINTYALSLEAIGSGAVAASPVQATYDHGDTVTVTPTPDGGHSFVNWAGDASGSDNPLEVVMDGPKNIAGLFSAALDLTEVGEGSVAKNPDQAVYALGDTVEISATPDGGHVFVDWAGDTISTTNPLQVILDDSKSITGRFSMILDVAVVGNGSVAKTPDLTTYSPDSLVQLHASPDWGWHFTGWSGDTTSTDTVITVTMDDSKSLTATFEINTYALDITVNGNGTVVRTPDMPAYDHGTLVTVTANPDSGFTFDSWSGDTTAADSIISFAMYGEKTLTASFGTILTVDVVGNGSVDKAPDKTTYSPSDSVVLTANPDVGWHFVDWTGDTTSTVNPITLSMSDNRDVTATFEINTYTLDIPIFGSGSIVKNPDQPTYDHGTLVELTAIPDSLHLFEGWSGDTTSTDPVITILMTGDRTIAASFDASVDVAISGNGSVVRDPDLDGYPLGSNVDLTATPDEGWHFVDWTGDTATAVNPLSLTLSDDVSLSANFEINTYVIDDSVIGNGSVVKIPDQPTYDHFTEVAVVAVPDTGWHFVGWSGDTTASADTLDLTITANRNLIATFAINTYTLDVTANDGSVVKAPDQPTYDHGTSVDLTATPDLGYHFTGWTGDATGFDNPLSLIMDANKNVIANFQINMYTLTTVTFGGGFIDVTPDQVVFSHGDSVTFIAQPDSGRVFFDWAGDVSSTAETLVVVMDSDKTVVGNFSVELDLTVTGSGAVGLGSLPSNGSLDRRVSDGLDDAEESSTGTMLLNSSDLEMVDLAGDLQTVGVRFTGIGIPPNSTIQNAYLQFQTDEVDSGATNLSIEGEAHDDAPAFSAATNDITLRSRTLASVAWAPPSWTTVGEEAAAQQTGDLTAIVQEIVDRPGWASGNALVMILSGTGKRTAVAYDGNPGGAPLLHIEWQEPAGPPTPPYAPGTQLVLTATPDGGHSFIEWDGDTSTTNNPITVTLHDDLEVESVFTTGTNLTIVGNGTVDKDPDQVAYSPGTSVQLTANPAANHHFVGWTGDVVSTDNPLLVTLDDTKDITATFEIDMYTADITIVGGGSVAKLPDQAVYDHGEVVQFTATPDSLWAFKNWTGSFNGTFNPIQLFMDGNKSLTATFGHTVDFTVRGQGSVAKVPDQPVYDDGATVQVTASADPGHQFIGWSGDTTSTDSTIDVTLFVNKHLVAQFTTVLDVAIVGDGSVVETPDQTSYLPTDSVDVEAFPATGWHFVSWTGDTTSGVNPLRIGMDDSRSLTANFAIDTFFVNTAVTGNGSVDRSPDQPDYDYGTPVSLTAVPDVGWHFIDWTGDTATTGNPIDIVVREDKSYTANFEINTYTLDVSTIGNGAVDKSPDQPLYDHGTDVTLTANPDPGWSFHSWSGDTSGSMNPLVVDMDAAKNITATFTLDPFTVDVTVTGSGSVTKIPDQPTYFFGAEVTLIAEYAIGSQFNAWSGDTTETNDTLRIVVTGDRIFTADFDPIAADTYVWNVNGTGNYLTSGNWTPTRNGTSTSDVLIFDGRFTPNVTLNGYDKQDLAGWKVINGANLTMNMANDEELRIVGGPNPNFVIGSGSAMTVVGGSKRLKLRIQTGTTASIAGALAFEDADHEILPEVSGTFVVHDGGSLRYDPGLTHFLFDDRDAEDVAIFESGATYIHESGEFWGLAAPAGKVVFQPGSRVVYRTTEGYEANQRTYGDLRIENNTSISSSGANLSVASIEVESGSSFSHNGSSSLTISGDVINDGSSLLSLSSGGSTIPFNGGGLQRIGGSGSGGVSIANDLTTLDGATLAIGTTVSFGGSVTADATVQIEDGASVSGPSDFVFGPNAELIFANETTQVTGGGLYWPAANGPDTVRVLGAGGVDVTGNRTAALLQVAGPISGGNNLTVTDRIRMEAGGSVTGAPDYDAATELRYLGGAVASDEWQSGSATSPGVPGVVYVEALSDSVVIPSGTRKVQGDLIVGSGVLAMTGTGEIWVNGDLDVQGSIDAGGRRIVFNADGVLQRILGPGELVIDYLGLAKNGGAVRLERDVRLLAPGAGNSIVFTGDTGEHLELNGHTLTLDGPVFSADSTSAFLGDAAARMILQTGFNFGTIRFAPGGQVLDLLRVNTAGGGVTLDSDLTVEGTLELELGRVSPTGSNALILGTSANLIRTSGFVEGNFRKPVVAGPTEVTFELGTLFNYTPVTVTFDNVSGAGQLTAAAIAAAHPEADSAGFVAGRRVNRHYRLSNQGVVFDRYSAVFSFIAADVDAGSDPSLFEVRRFADSDWSGSDPGTRDPLSTEADSLTGFGDFAIGELQQHVVFATAGPEGSITPSGPVVVSHGKSQTFTINSNFPYHVGDVLVDGQSVGTDSVQTVSDVETDGTIEAFFAINNYPLTTQVVGRGTVQRTPDQPGFDHGTSPQLVAIPDSGHVFVDWIGDTTSTNSIISLAMLGPRTVTARFSTTLQVLTAGDGVVGIDPDTSVYALGDTVTLTPAGQVGWAFTHWSGDASGSQAPLNVVMDDNKTITANFMTSGFTVTVNAANGTVMKEPDQPLYAFGDSVTFVAIPDSGYQFVKYSGAIGSVENPIGMRVFNNSTVTAEFTPGPEPQLTVVSDGGGTVDVSPDLPSYQPGQAVTLTAVADSARTFNVWYGDVISTTNARDSVVVTVLMDRDRTIHATFSDEYYNLWVTPVGNGSVVKNPAPLPHPQGVPQYFMGTDVELTAMPDSGFHFVEWLDQATGTFNPTSVTMDVHTWVRAIFGYRLDVAVSGNGTVNLGGSRRTFAVGDSVQISAAPRMGYRFVGWSGGATGNQNPLTVVMDDNKNIVANFATDGYMLNVTVVGQGTVTKSPDQPTYLPGATVFLSVLPDSGWHFVEWKYDGGDVIVQRGGGGIQVPCTICPPDLSRAPVEVFMNADKHFTAIFAADNPAAHASQQAGPEKVIEIVRPRLTETLEIGRTFEFEWALEDRSEIQDVDVLISRTGPHGPFEPVARAVSADQSYRWIVTGPAQSDIYVRLVARDATGAEHTDTRKTTIVASVVHAIELALSPNPARGPVQVAFALPDEARVRLSIHDIQGREVVVLSDGMLAPGRHQMTWNRHSKSGSAEPGVYFVRFNAGGQSVVRRLTLTR